MIVRALPLRALRSRAPRSRAPRSRGPRSRGRRAAALASCTLAASLLFTGCTAGPDPGPAVVHGDGGGASDGDGPATLPTLSAPAKDLNYRDCGDRLDDYDTRVPKGLKLDCASYESPIDPDQPAGATLTVGVVRAQLADTPADTAPLIVTTGTDLPASRLLLSLDVDAMRPLLSRHPLIAVDRRGTGLSNPLDCLTRSQREVLAENGAGTGRDVATRADLLARSARAGADICNDTLSPDQLQFSDRDAAADLEQLRSRWDVDRIGILAIGSGSSTAIAYAGAHPDRLGRLILDSPIGFQVAAPEAAAARAAGLQNSLASFAERCAAVGCSLAGGNPTAALQRVISAGAAGSLTGLSDTTVLSAVTTALALGDGSPEALKELADAITAADRGRPAALRRLADEAATVRTTDGQQVGRCNDLAGRPGLGDLPGLATQWSEDAPMTAVSTALDLARCDGWGTADTPGAPTRFGVDPLILLNANDPVNGLKAAEGLSPLLITAAAELHTVSWDGIGYSVVRSSECAASVALEYLGDAPLSGQRERACPS